jgi:hypothetical protein
MLLSLNIRLRPCGPIIAPAKIRPIRWGIRNLLNSIGAIRIINKITANISTGLAKGSLKLSRILANITLQF